jgi:UDP-glucose 4-epimerase
MIKKILITGGNGYIGARLSLYLADKGYEVTPLCFPEIPQDESWRNKMTKVLCGDIRNEDFLREISTCSYDAIVHLVSLDHHQSAGSPSFVSAVNITPTWSLLDIFSKSGLKKFLFFSTVQVYGKMEAEIITEENPIKPINAYALTHLLGEQFCDYYNRNSKTSCHVVRLSNSYGAPVFEKNNCWWLVINDLCRMAFTEQKILLQSDGSPQRDFIHGWDVVKAVEFILKSEAEQMTYNISSGTTMTIMEIAFHIKRIFQSRYKKTIDIITSMGKIDSPIILTNSRYMIDNSAIKRLGYESEWDMDKGINDLFIFFEKHQS